MPTTLVGRLSALSDQIRRQRSRSVGHRFARDRRGRLLDPAPLEREGQPPVQSRPLLRGWSHAVAACGAVAFTVALFQHETASGPSLATLLLYGLSSVWLFGCSAAYHLFTWSPPRRKLLRALDHGNIYVATATTWTAVGANVLDGWQRLMLLATVWVLALTSVAVSLFRVRLSAAPRVGLCLLTGFSGVIVAPWLLAALPLEAIGGLLAGAVLYTVGGVVYAIRRPNPFPRVFGYHEVFHLFVIAGGAAFGAVIWIWVMPAAGR